MFKRSFLIIVIFITSLSADYMITVDDTDHYCITDYWYESSGDTSYILSSGGTVTTRYSTDVENGYYLNGSVCEKEQILKDLGMKYEDYSFINAQIGLALNLLFFGGFILILGNARLH